MWVRGWVPYIIDTDAIVHLADRPDGVQIYASLIQQVRDGDLYTVEQVFGELRTWPDIRARFMPVKKVMCLSQYTPEIMATVGYISETFDFLYDLSGSHNPDPADPWLIAAAKHLGYCLVTDERRRSVKKIPFVCRQQGVDVDCINGPEFIARCHHA
jgi:hypothetical protein